MNRGTVERAPGAPEPRPAAFPLDRGLQELQGDLHSAVEGMTEAQWMWHPADKWCAAEVLEHLYLTYTGTIKGFERVLQGDKPAAARASLKKPPADLGSAGIQLSAHWQKISADCVTQRFTC